MCVLLPSGPLASLATRLASAPSPGPEGLSLGLDLSPGGILASLLVSSVGYVLFTYGRKQSRFPQLVTGLLLLAETFFAPGASWMLGIAGGLLMGFWLALRAGL